MSSMLAIALAIAIPVPTEAPEAVVAEAGLVRLKDITRIVGLGRHKLVGYGLVVGLDGTGDGRRAEFTPRAVANMLEQFGHRLLTVHIHDNKGSDAHTLPYEGTIDWDRFRKIFHGLRYSGNLLLEVHIRHSQFKDPAVFLSQARKRAERLLQSPVGDRE